ncbi:DoxX family protein [Bradyrhizobium genosp. A]|uniref:DoxX family protein n=1 Tax=Bradyrhizobium genosp. A TaxID=83626 RepID=UPI003CEF047A
MIHAVSVYLLIAGLFGAGLYNAIGTPATQSSFIRWGCPRWWSTLTGGLEMVCAVLIALPASRIVGLTLAAAIISAAVLTVLRHREFSHLVPLGVFATLMALAGTLP